MNKSNLSDQILRSSDKHKGMLPWNIVAEGLCVRCGACTSLCPKSLLVCDDRNYPVLEDPEKRCDSCGHCMTACPGGEVNIPQISVNLFGTVNDYFHVLGIYKDALIGYSRDDAIRRTSSAGGIITQILVTLLREGYIKKALVAGMSTTQPWKGEPTLATTVDKIIECTQSKYTIVPQMKLLGELIRCHDSTALVGLPCHIHAFRKYQSKFPRKVANVKVVIGLFCHLAIEIEGTEKMIERAGIQKKDLLRIEYRGGEWPGQVRAILKNGEIRALHTADYKDGAFNYLKYLYYPERCLTCIDFSAELADLSVGDPWLRQKDGKYIYKGGHSLVLVRNDRARKVINMAHACDDINIEPVDETLLAHRFVGMKEYKKIGAQIRIEALKRKGLAYPKYDYDVPQPDFFDVMKEKAYSLTRVLGKSQKGRDFGSMIAFSGIGDKLNIIRRLRKELLARYQYR